MFALLKKDLLEFVSVVSTDTTDAISTVVAQSLEVIPKVSSVEDRRLLDPCFYTDALSGDEYVSFKQRFDVVSRTDDISAILEDQENVSLKSLHADLVPRLVSYAEFWGRYFFQVQTLSTKARLLVDLNDDDNLDLGWEGDEDPSKAEHLPEKTLFAGQMQSGFDEGEGENFAAEITRLRAREALLLSQLSLERSARAGSKERYEAEICRLVSSLSAEKEAHSLMRAHFELQAGVLNPHQAKPDEALSCAPVEILGCAQIPHDVPHDAGDLDPDSDAPRPAAALALEIRGGAENTAAVVLGHNSQAIATVPKGDTEWDDWA